MPFFQFDHTQRQSATATYSRAPGSVMTGTQIEVGLLHFDAGKGAAPHAHPEEQAMFVLAGRLRVALEGETRELGVGQGFLAAPNVEHQVTALEDADVLTCKGLLETRGHRG